MDYTAYRVVASTCIIAHRRCSRCSAVFAEQFGAFPCLRYSPPFPGVSLVPGSSIIMKSWLRSVDYDTACLVFKVLV